MLPLYVEHLHTCKMMENFHQRRMHFDEERKPQAEQVGDAKDGDKTKKDDIRISMTENAFSLIFIAETTTAAFWVSILYAIIQLSMICLVLADMIQSKNPDNPLGAPTNVSSVVRIAGFMSLFLSVALFWDLMDAVDKLIRGPAAVGQSHRGMQIKFYLAFTLQLATGFIFLITVFILIVQSTQVIEMLFNYAGMQFITDVDDVAFKLASLGYAGESMRKDCEKVKYFNLPPPKRPYLRRIIYYSVIVVLFIMYAFIIVKQQNGQYDCRRIEVQFGDGFIPHLPVFSGQYTYVNDFHDGRAIYKVDTGKEIFRYCFEGESGYWVFGWISNVTGIENLDDLCTNFVSRTPHTSGFGILDTQAIHWMVKKEVGAKLEISADYFAMRCADCDESNCQINDKAHGSVDYDRNTNPGDLLYYKQDQYVCMDGRFGLNCEFSPPCTTLEIDELDPEGFTGTRKWSRIFRIIEEDRNASNGPMRAYNKPIYIGDDEFSDGVFDVILFIGRRWILTDSVHFKDYRMAASNSTGKKEFAKFLHHHFHGYWSKYSFFFVSEAVDIRTPNDAVTPVGLRWFRLENDASDSTRGFDFTSKDAKNRWKEKPTIKTKLFCVVCDNQTNPCKYGANCMSNGTCDCSTGSKGKMCQISPDGNGFCDVYFNTPIFDYDGGDCCRETCKSTEEHICGRIGFPNCTDSRYSSKLSGSKTLYEIVERGRLKCGSIILNGFLMLKGSSYVGFGISLCKSIAAAVLGDPEAIEIVEVDSIESHFTGLANGNFDVLVSITTYTAERDIYQTDANVGFTFASSPFYYDGLTYGGKPPFVECVINLDYESLFCKDLCICVVESFTWFARTKELFPSKHIVAVKNIEAEFNGLKAGLCNVIAGESYIIGEPLVRKAGFKGEYKLGTNLHSKEPLALVTREDDLIWSKFVSWVFEALLQAEESGISKQTAHKLAPANVFGSQFQNMFQNAVAANGNYGEIYLKNFQKVVERNSLNTINRGKTSLIYSIPLGKTNTQGNGPMPGGTIQRIIKRGTLNCGIQKVPGFASLDANTLLWKGIDIDICRGIAAALFKGSPNVNIISVSSLNRFESLASGSVDILTAWTTHTMQREVKEPTTGLSFDFSPSYFYDGLGFGGSPPYVMCADEFNFEKIEPNANCADTRICIQKGSSWLDALQALNVPDANLVVTLSIDEGYNKLSTGECNVVAGESVNLLHIAREYDHTNRDILIGSKKHTKEPIGAVTNSDDNQFSDFVRWIVLGFFFAAERDIEKSNYFEMPPTNLFGNSMIGMWQNAIEVVGNYDDIMARNFGDQSGYNGLNSVNSKNGPQHYAIPGIKILK